MKKADDQIKDRMPANTPFTAFFTVGFISMCTIVCKIKLNSLFHPAFSSKQRIRIILPRKYLLHASLVKI